MLNLLTATMGVQKVMHSSALLEQDFANLVYIWHKHDRAHLFVIVTCFSFIFRFLNLNPVFQMAALLEARKKKRAVIEFLVAEEETPLRIHKRLKNVYKNNTKDCSNVQTWVQLDRTFLNLIGLIREAQSNRSVFQCIKLSDLFKDKLHEL